MQIAHHLSELWKKQKRLLFYETPCSCICARASNTFGPAAAIRLAKPTAILSWFNWWLAGMLTRPDYGENENETKNHENENIGIVKFYV